MSTEFIRTSNPETGVNFIHTVHTDEDGVTSTTRTSTMLDQLTNAALCRQEAGWLKAALKFNLGESDPEVEEILTGASERGAGIEPIAKHMRRIDAKYVFRHINHLTAVAETLEQQANAA